MHHVIKLAAESILRLRSKCGEVNDRDDDLTQYVL